MTEHRVSTSTDLAGRWRRLCEAMLGELRPESGWWWRSGAFWLLSWVVRRRVRREAAALAEMIQAMMQEVLTALEAFQAGKLPPVAQPEGARRTGIACGSLLDSGPRSSRGQALRRNDECGERGVTRMARTSASPSPARSHAAAPWIPAPDQAGGRLFAGLKRVAGSGVTGTPTLENLNRTEWTRRPWCGVG